MASASIEARDGGRWRVRWKEKADGAWRSRERTIHGSKVDAEDYRLRVIRALEDGGTFDPAADEKARTGPASLIDGILSYVKASKADGLIGEKTERESKGRALRLAEEICALRGIPEDQPIPVTVLGRPLFDDLKPRLAARGTSVGPLSLGLLFRAWGWMADDAANWPHVPHCPRSSKGYVPTERVLGRTVAPKVQHTDAMLRRLADRVESSGRKGNPDTVVFALLLRYTGLRRSQVYGIHREDFDARNGLLTVRTGKSKQEKADRRTIPLSRHFFAEPAVKVWISERLPHRKPGARLLTVRCVDGTMRRAWEDATALDGVPEHTWNPPQRTNARPDHAFRACFKAEMQERKVSDDIWKWLIGHTSGMADTHYGRDLEEIAREAVDALPPVDWTGPAVAHGGNVVRLAR